ncbi:glutamic acid-rich protein-like [Palaemon carinicauda]|uniref:glutamic acid-rich protein-like n=1 Tax=Palaemon carinicauda TaxID=392227 RepID=UPI0035B582EA
MEKQEKESEKEEKKKNKKKIEGLEKKLLHHHNQKEKENELLRKQEINASLMGLYGKKENKITNNSKDQKKKKNGKEEKQNTNNQRNKGEKGKRKNKEKLNKEKEENRKSERLKKDRQQLMEKINNSESIDRTSKISPKKEIRTGQPLNGTFIEQEIVDHINNGTPPWDRENYPIPRQRKCDTVMVVHHNNPLWEEFLKDKKEREEEYHKKNERSQEEEQAKKTTDPNRQKEQEEIIARLNIEIKRLGFRLEILHERVIKGFRNKRKEIKRLQKELRREDKINALIKKLNSMAEKRDHCENDGEDDRTQDAFVFHSYFDIEGLRFADANFHLSLHILMQIHQEVGESGWDTKFEDSIPHNFTINSDESFGQINESNTVDRSQFCS